MVALPAGVEDRAGRRAAERLERGVVEAARPQRAAEHEHARHLGRQAEAQARGRLVGRPGAGRHGPSGDGVPAAVATLDRERQEHLSRERRQHAVGDAQVAVGLGERQREPQGARREPHGAGHVAPATEDHVGAAGAQQPARAACGANGEQSGAQRSERVAPRDAAHLHAVEAGTRPPGRAPPRRGRRRRTRPRHRCREEPQRPRAPALRARPSRRPRSRPWASRPPSIASRRGLAARFARPPVAATLRSSPMPPISTTRFVLP